MTQDETPDAAPTLPERRTTHTTPNGDPAMPAAARRTDHPHAHAQHAALTLEQIARATETPVAEIRDLAGRDFEPWTRTDLAELQIDQIPQRAAQDAETLVSAARMLTKSRPDLVRTAERMTASLGPDAVLAYLEDMVAARAFFDACATMLTAITARFAAALAAPLIDRPAGDDSPATPTDAPAAPRTGAQASALLDHIRTIVGGAGAAAEADSIASFAGEWLRAFDDFEEAFDLADAMILAANRRRPVQPPEGAPLATMTRWREQCAAIDATLGVDALDARQGAACVRADRIADRIAGMQPSSPAEAALKLAIIMRRHDLVSEDGGPALVAVVADLARLAGHTD
jgi:hypothetical protein